MVISSETRAALVEELNDLQNVKLPAARACVTDARSAGDISENTDFVIALEDEKRLLSRVSYIEDVLKNATNTDQEGVDDGGIGVGAVVTIAWDEGDTETFVVGSIVERHSKYPVVTPNSPVGEALIGAEVGDNVCAQTPQGDLPFVIVSVEYP